ncbi:hypothetical protein FXQ12_19320 [Salmonella enterica]|nr:hypothetical protein [Salmonella enterica]ECC9413382.1 hypothetical protein [Salmonella enterica subsp. enterica]EHF2792496.1 hypothetical protein [Salmonella enterica subsp. enterica serovar 4,5,12:b:-]EHG1527832.1 hypothetical protein [Salmonella enterica subsp. enterica serovar 4,[5],12:b:-]ECD8847283.1 hypothetical protein [Salmonella enterica subsp. enterica]
MQRAEGGTVHVGGRAIPASSVNRNSWRLRANGSRCYPVGTGKMQAVRADSETAVTRNDAEQARKVCFARRKPHEREQAKQAALSGMA